MDYREGQLERKGKRENNFHGHPSLKEKANKWDLNSFHENKTYGANAFHLKPKFTDTSSAYKHWTARFPWNKASAPSEVCPIGLKCRHYDVNVPFKKQTNKQNTFLLRDLAACGHSTAGI